MSRLSYTYTTKDETGEEVTVNVFRSDQLGTGEMYYGSNSMGAVKTVVNGEIHSVHDQPSLLFDDGSRQYHRNGKLHRVNGPALITADGGKFWYYNGTFIGSENEVDFDQKWFLATNVPIHPRVRDIRNTNTENDPYMN